MINTSLFQYTMGAEYSPSVKQRSKSAKTMKKVKLLLFGGFRLININGETLTPSARKAKALLAWLAVNPDQQYPREKLAAVLWPDSDETQGRHSLRQALADLRKVIPDDNGPLHTTKDWIMLDSGQIDVDVHIFNACLAAGDEAALDQAIDAYKGEFLEGCNPHSDSFDEWLATYRADFSVRASAAIEQRLQQLLEQQDYERACYFAVRLLGIEPLQEQAYRALMQAHAGLGNLATALRWYRRCRSLLQRELGVEPDPATQALYKALMAGQEDTDPAVAEEEAAAYCLPCNSGNPASRKPLGSRERVLYLLESALEGILDQIGGQGFLIRGESSSEKSVIIKAATQLAASHGFSCCQRQIPQMSADTDGQVIQALIGGSTDCLSRQPVLLVVEDIHLASMDTLKLLAELIAVAGSGDILLLMTSCFGGEPLDPVWRGAMRGAPLTTIDL